MSFHAHSIGMKVVSYSDRTTLGLVSTAVCDVLGVCLKAVSGTHDLCKGWTLIGDLHAQLMLEQHSLIISV